VTFDGKKKNHIQLLGVISWLAVVYLAAKLILVPLASVVIPAVIPDAGSHLSPSTEPADSPIPDIAASDLGLIALILLFQPATGDLIKSLKISKDGIEAEFREFKEKIEGEIDAMQQKQIDELDQMQAFMFGFLLSPKEYEKVSDLKRHSEAGTPYRFYVGMDAARELRRLRDFNLIRTKDSRYISSIETESDYGKKAIDLTQYCSVTDLGRRFLQVRQNLDRPPKPADPEST